MVIVVKCGAGRLKHDHTRRKSASVSRLCVERRAGAGTCFNEHISISSSV